jgi:hypothetical protein
MGARVPRLFPGATVACLATGPSLTPEVCDQVRAAGLPTIAINDAHRLAPWADVLYSSDRHWWPFYKGVPAFTGMKFGIGSAPGKANAFAQHPEIAVLRNTGYDGLELEPTGLRNGKNSGYAAINLAVHLGAARMLLLGYNMGYRGGRAHFFGNHPPGLTQRESTYTAFRARFETLVDPLAEIGVEVLNCTAETSLTAFPVCDLALALETHQAVPS